MFSSRKTLVFDDQARQGRMAACGSPLPPLSELPEDLRGLVEALARNARRAEKRKEQARKVEAKQVVLFLRKNPDMVLRKLVRKNQLTTSKAFSVVVDNRA